MPGRRGAGAVAPSGQQKQGTGAARLLSPLWTRAELKAHDYSLPCVDVRALARRSPQPVVGRYPPETSVQWTFHSPL